MNLQRGDLHTKVQIEFGAKDNDYYDHHCRNDHRSPNGMSSKR